MFCRTLTNRFAVYMYGSISQFPSVIGLLLTGFIADRLGVENIFIIGGVAISINISYPYIRIKEEKSPITIDYQRLFFFFSDPPGARTQDPNIKSVVLYLLS